MEELSVVKVVHLLTEDRHFDGSDRVMRPPQVGDTGTIVHVNAPGKSYIVESVDHDGYTIWLADFDEAELELVEEV
jgi:hypothetical protein